jgi:chemotaxis protein histidine kinase CheA
MAEWRVRGRQNAKNAKERLLAFGSVVWINSQKVADQLRARGAEWVQRWHASRQLARERAAEAAAAREAKLQQARLLAQEQARILAQAESLRQELERERLLAEQQQRERQAQEAAARAALLREQREREAALHEQKVREQRAREASTHEVHFTQQQEQHEAQQNELPQPETEQEKLWVPAAHDAAPSLPPRSVRYAPQPRTSLLAYTRNRSRDLKMAFLGAAAASALILFASFGFMHRTPPGRDMQQKLPFGAATVGPSTPSLILPTAKPAPAPAQVRVVAKQKKQPAPLSRHPANYRPARTQQEALEDEVVVRHFPTAGHAAKARPDNDGVRRISDLQ